MNCLSLLIKHLISYKTVVLHTAQFLQVYVQSECPFELASKTLRTFSTSKNDFLCFFGELTRFLEHRSNRSTATGRLKSLNLFSFIWFLQEHYCCSNKPFMRQATYCNKKHLKDVGPIRHNEPPHANSPGVATVLSHAACASMSTTPTTTTTTTRDRRDRYGPMEWAQ